MSLLAVGTLALLERIDQWSAVPFTVTLGGCSRRDEPL